MTDASELNLLSSFVRRKFSGKSKKWKSIFNIGRSLDPKGKLSRNGSVLIRAQGMTGKDSHRRELFKGKLAKYASPPGNMNSQAS